MTTKQDLIAHARVTIDAPIKEVWRALTTPEQIKKYLFGTDAISDWKVGSPLVFRGEWEGKSYEDKGVIKVIDPPKFFQHTYWSSMSGKEDTEENYTTVTYELTEQNGKTTIQVSQDNNETEKSKEHSEQNWSFVLTKLKDLLEKRMS